MNAHLRSLAALPWLVCGLATHAATYTWTGAGFLGSKDQLWSNRFNWAGNVPIPVVLNQGPSPLEGAFDSLPEGAPYPIGATVWRIPYIGGTGGDVMLQPDASAPAQFSQPKVLADGTIELHAVTDPDTEYDIEVTAELGAPRSWTRIHTVRSSAAGEVRFSDPDAPLAPSGPLLPVPEADPVAAAPGPPGGPNACGDLHPANGGWKTAEDMGLDATRRRQWIHRQGAPCSPRSSSGICDICGFNGRSQIHSPFRLWVR